MCRVHAFIIDLQLQPVKYNQILDQISYLCSSQVSGNVHVLCHLHRQAKVHQHCLV